MKNTTKIAAVAAVAAFAAVPATAGLIDFTDDSVGVGVDSTTFMGNAAGVAFTVTSNTTGLNRDQAFDGPNVADISPLAGQNDGFGIVDDESTTGDFLQTITVSFDREVTITTAYFLDVFLSGSGADGETARLNVGAAADVNDFDAEVAGNELSGDGFATITGMFTGSSFTFFAGPGVDDGSADISLAGLEIAPIPLPAGMLLLGTALGGLGIARRRKKSA